MEVHFHRWGSTENASPLRNGVRSLLQLLDCTASCAAVLPERSVHSWSSALNHSQLDAVSKCFVIREKAFRDTHAGEADGDWRRVQHHHVQHSKSGQLHDVRISHWAHMVLRT